MLNVLSFYFKPFSQSRFRLSCACTTYKAFYLNDKSGYEVAAFLKCRNKRKLFQNLMLLAYNNSVTIWFNKMQVETFACRPVTAASGASDFKQERKRKWCAAR
jgi:hypothetical protein